jgi:hypothetical protein
MSAKIALALHEIMSKVGYVQKTGKNAFHGYKYAGEADLLEKLRPAMIEAGLILIPSVQHAAAPDEHGNVLVMVEYTLVHKDGDVWPEKIGAVGCGNDRAKNGSIGDKGVYKALTGANKYLLFKLFQIETGDDPERDEEPAPPRKSSASIKRESPDAWPKLEASVRAATNRADLTAVWREWKDTFEAWPASWKSQVDELFSVRAGEVADRSVEVIGPETPASAAEPLTHPVRYRNTHGAPVGKVRDDYFETTEEDLEGFRKKAAAE